MTHTTRPGRTSTLLPGALGLTLGACHPPAPPQCSECAEHEAEIAGWRAQRLAELRGDQGWLTLAGLYWLREGEQRLGSAADADLQFPAGAPAEVGTVTLQDGVVQLHVKPGVDARIGDAVVRDTPLRSDADPTQPPDRVTIAGRFTFLILSRGDRLGLRLYDVQSPARQNFTGIDTYPVADKWRITARFEPYPTPRLVDHPTVIGTTKAELPGVAVFTLDGAEQRLTPIREHGPHGDELLFVFRDGTSDGETYPGGRFLVTALPKDSAFELNFNKAHNPPCAFTPYATCPLPLPENRLAIRVEAGEKTPAGHD
ncbi:MAG TPA: DUF1684 domain-containing protein [Nannocystis sp.]|jgi:hypothetical protein